MYRSGRLGSGVYRIIKLDGAGIDPAIFPARLPVALLELSARMIQEGNDLLDRKLREFYQFTKRTTRSTPGTSRYFGLKTG